VVSDWSVSSRGLREWPEQQQVAKTCPVGILRAVLHSLTAESESVFITRVEPSCDSHVTGQRLDHQGQHV